MKKMFIKSLFLILVMVSCTSTLDRYAINPNSPRTTNPDLLLVAMEVATFGNYAGGNVLIPALYVQQIAGTSQGQFGAYSRYDVTEQTTLNSWESLYADAIEPGITFTQLYPTAYDRYNGIVKILLAFNFGVTTDLWGDIPFYEASKGLSEKNLTPAYDSQQDVINGIQSFLNEAITLLEGSQNTSSPGSDDLIFNGDISKWKKIAYLLKARYALRITKRQSVYYDSAQIWLDSANMKSNADDMNAVFPNSGGNSKNQWKAFQDGRKDYVKMGNFFINLMKTKNDPRLPFFATKDKSGGYSGNVLGDESSLHTSDIGSAIAANTRPIGLVTYVEAKFMEAEVYQQKNDDTKAKEAYKQAITASIKKVVLDTISNSRIATFVQSVTPSGVLTLENIIEQKYVALFSSIEPYNDYRRTGFPTLQVNPKATGNIKIIPLRLPISSEERLYNPNAKIVSDVTEPVWWDVD